MLNIAKVIVLSQERRFDTVVFFDRDPDAVLETQKRIPGAIGFPGNFVDVVLTEAPAADLAEEANPLDAPLDSQDVEATTKQQIRLAQRAEFIRSFPFDILNLDLEEFAFKAHDPFPGKVINALRKIFEWQTRSFNPWPDRPSKTIQLDGFTLMFTTQIGPPNIGPDYTDMLYDYLQENLETHPQLRTVLRQRTGVDDIRTLQREQFDTFFKLGVPKVIAKLLLERDWYVDPDCGITTFAFKRNSESGEYTMLHFVMDVRRQVPPRTQRAPDAGHAGAATAAYATVVQRLFAQADIEVTNALAGSVDLRPSLAQIKGRRKLYYPEEEQQ